MFEAPKIVISPTLRSNIVNGGRVILSCAMEGCPAPMMSWYHDGVELHSDARRVISMVKDHVLAVGSLEINSVREEDGGEYWCSGSNGVGPDVVSDNITLNVPPPQSEHSISKRSVEEIKDSLCDSTSPDTGRSIISYSDQNNTVKLSIYSIKNIVADDNIHLTYICCCFLQ